VFRVQYNAKRYEQTSAKFSGSIFYRTRTKRPTLPSDPDHTPEPGTGI